MGVVATCTSIPHRSSMLQTVWLTSSLALKGEDSSIETGMPPRGKDI